MMKYSLRQMDNAAIDTSERTIEMTVPDSLSCRETCGSRDQIPAMFVVASVLARTAN